SSAPSAGGTGSVATPPLLGADWRIALSVDRGLHRVPRERGAFDPDRIFGHSAERSQRTERGVAGVLARDHRVEPVEDVAHFRARLSRDRRGHERRAGFRDSAPLTLETGFGNLFAVDPHPHRDLIAAERVLAFRVSGRML